MKQSICFHIKENPQLPTPCWASSVLQFQHAGWCSTRRLLSFRALSLQPSWVLICPNHLWGSSELQPTGAEMGFITAAPVLAHFSLFALSLCLSVRRHLAGTLQKREPAAWSSTSLRCHNLSFFFFFFSTRDEAFYEAKWVPLKWSSTKAPWLICLLGYCSCHLGETSGQQID